MDRIENRQVVDKEEVRETVREFVEFVKTEYLTNNKKYVEVVEEDNTLKLKVGYGSLKEGFGIELDLFNLSNNTILEHKKMFLHEFFDYLNIVNKGFCSSYGVFIDDVTGEEYQKEYITVNSPSNRVVVDRYDTRINLQVF